MRGSITKGRSGHYTMTLRDSDGALVCIVDKLPTIHAARAELAKAKRDANKLAAPSAPTVRTYAS